MPWNSLILITVLFGVICGNRFVDNRLLRSTYSSNNNKLIGDTTSKTLNANAKLLDFPCASEFDLKHTQTARNCNENFVSLLKPAPNYMTYENEDSPSSMKDFDEMFDAATSIDANDAKLFRPLLSSLPLAKYEDFYTELVVGTSTKEEMIKRSGNTIGSSHGTPSTRGCECKVRNDLLDLGQNYYPRYLLKAVCQSEQSRHQHGSKCWSGAVCRPLEYKVRVLTFRTSDDNMQNDPWLPDDLRQIWKFNTVAITAGCFCS